MKKHTILTALMALAMATGLTGCAMFNKGSVQYTRTTTLGQELMDLQEARTKTAITEEEYNRAKKEILEATANEVHFSCDSDD